MEVARTGRIGFGDLTLRYDQKVLKASFEEIPVTGTGIDWEEFRPGLYRISLSVETASQKGSYRILDPKVIRNEFTGHYDFI